MAAPSKERLVFICLVVYAIVALGEVLPAVFNNYAFMFFLVSGLASRLEGVTPDPLLWIGIQSIGGAVVILGIMAISKLVRHMARACSHWKLLSGWKF